MSLDVPCEHVFIEDEGLHLEIDCTACQGASDLSNPRCFVGVLNAMASGAVPDAIILKRYIHKRYRRDAVIHLAMANSELAALNRAIASLESPSDKRCRTCVASKENTIRLMKQKLLENPAAYLLGSWEIPQEILTKSTVENCGQAARCIEEGLFVSTLYRRNS